MVREKKKLLVIIVFLVVLCSALGGFLLRPATKRADAATFFGQKNVEDLRNADPADIAALPQYSGRDYGILTTVKNQGAYSLCWAYATIAASETSILREGVGNVLQPLLDLEERNLAYWAHNPRADEFGLISDDVVEGNGSWNKGGYTEVAGQALLQWMGPVKQFSDRESTLADDNEEEIEGIHPLAYKLESTVTIPYSVENVKRLVAEYGAAAFSFPIHTYENGYYNIDKYFNNSGQSSRNPHACIIVGWDDSIPADRFSPIDSETNGGWIVKNSWGSGWTTHEDGYFYLSYDSTIYDIWAFDYTTADAFDHQYFYNGSLSYAGGSVYGEGETAKAAAIYCAQGGTAETREVLNAVNIGIGGGVVDVKVSIFTGLEANYGNPFSPSNLPDEGTPVAVKETTVTRDGYYTVYLDEPVPLENGESFSVVVEAKSRGEKKAHIFTTIDYASTNDMTFEFTKDGWKNLQSHSKYSAHIHAYTKNVAREEALDQNDLRFAKIALTEQTFTYCAEDIEPDVTVTLGGKVLTKGEDYELRYEENRNALQNARVIAEGRGEYTGTCCGYFRILQAQYPLNRPVRDENEPIVVGCEVTHLGQIPLPAGWKWYHDVDFTVYYDGMLDRVSDWAIVYVGEDKDNYKITQTGVYVLRESRRHDLISLEGATVTQAGPCVYTGKTATPHFSVELDGKELTEGVNYTVTTSSVNAGNAEAEIVGIGSYTGKVRAAFTIDKAEKPTFPNSIPTFVNDEGDTLDEISLPENWEWVEGEAVLVQGRMRASVRYTGADAANYETVLLDLEFEVVLRAPDVEDKDEDDPDKDNDGKDDETEGEGTVEGNDDKTDGDGTSDKDGSDEKSDEENDGKNEGTKDEVNDEKDDGTNDGVSKGCFASATATPIILCAAALVLRRKRR